MKKIIKIAAFLCLVIAIALPLVSCLKISTQYKGIPVNDLNGMTVTQLFEKFINDYNSSNTREVQINSRYYNGTRYVTDSKYIKANGDDFYFLYVDLSNSGYNFQTVEIFLVDDVAYIDYQESKIKCYKDDIDVVWGENFMTPFIRALEQEVAEEYYAALAKAQLYLKNGVYFFTISLPVPETNYSYTQTVYFDKDGKITKIIEEGTNWSDERTIKYDVPVEIAPPVHKYHETPKLPKTDAEIYQLYVDGCTTMQESHYLWVDIRVPGTNSIYYNRNGENKNVRVFAESRHTEHWLFNKNGYARLEDGVAFKTPIDETFLKEFASIETLFPITPYPQEELENFHYRYDKDLSRSKVSFERVDESGTRCYYEYIIPNKMSYLNVVINKNPGTVNKEQSNFYFNIDPSRKVTPPSIP